MDGKKLMRRASTYIALCALVGACTTASAAVAGAAPAPTAHAAGAMHEAHGSRGARRAHKQREPTIRLKLIGTSYTPVYTDGVRWAVYEPTVGVTRIMDTLKGKSTTRPDPEGCAGGLLAIGGGEILYACSDPECPKAADACLLKTPETQCPPPGLAEPCRVVITENRETGRWIVEDIVSGAQHIVAIGGGVPLTVSRYGKSLSELTGIGSQWARGETNSRFFVNWHTGRVVKEGSEPASANLDYENLDSEALLEPLCRPLTRHRTPSVEMQTLPRYFTSAYSPLFMVQERFKAYEVHGHAYLQRCGSTRKEPIPELEGVGAGVQLGSGVLSGYRRLWRLNAHRRPWLGRSYRLIGPLASRELLGGSSQQHTATITFETIDRRPGAVVPLREGAPWGHGSELYAVWVGRLPWVKAGR